MSDVDTISSLPAALDAGQSALANNVNNHQSPSGPSFPKEANPQSFQLKDSDVAPKSKVDSTDEANQPLSPKADSEAETIIQSGRESVSPEKRRKYIKHDPKRRDEGNEKLEEPEEGELPPNDLQVRKRKRLGDDSHDVRDFDLRRSRSPARSPRVAREVSPSVVKTEKPEDFQSLQASREDSVPRSEKPRISRKRSFSESVDGDRDGHRARQNRSAARDLHGISLPPPASNGRSVSPVRPSHKRTVSGPQLSEASKKRKAPTPLTGFSRQGSEDRQSVSSSTSGSPMPSAHIRKLTSLDGTSASPARTLGPKKQRDQNGRTRLARACAASELETAIARHAERPEDLNVADNAGNTPLQIAALEGCAPIVEFLLSVDCEIDTKNIDKDTPLIDAVENGHLDVVKLLLDAGANPRTVNAEGDEPYELVPSDCDEYDEIRRVIADAKATPRTARRSEERKDPPSQRPSATSPRDSPPVHGGRSPPLFSGPSTTKRRTVRSEATRNDLLWTKPTSENLQAFAAKGDMAGVVTILNVGQKADPESMIAAAKGGHDEVLSLMLGMGFADPDPNPVTSSGQKSGYNTPMLAAIGRGNLEVIKLLLDQPGFNPTRRLFRDSTYFDLSRERKGENWEDEYELLRDAYDEYSRRKSRKPDISSPRRKENKRPARRESRSPVPRPKRLAGSPTRRDCALKEKRRDGVAHPKEKSLTARSKAPRRDSSDNETDGRLQSPRRKPRTSSTTDGESGTTSRGDEQPKRRRLIPGRPPQRRLSVLSSDSVSSGPEGTKPSEAVPSKRGPTLKRIRSSESPPRSRARDTTDVKIHSPETQKKKRRVLSEDGAPNVTNGGVKRSHDVPADVSKSHAPPRSIEAKDDDLPREHGRAASQKLGLASQKGVAVPRTSSNVVKEERDRRDVRDLEDIPMEDSVSKLRKTEAKAEDERRQAEKIKAEEERVATEKRRAAEAEQAHQARVEEDERAASLVQEKAEEDRKRKEAEHRRLKQAEDDRQKRLEHERLRMVKLRREQEEQEQRRRDALPNRLRVAADLVGSNDPRAKSHAWLKRFMPLVTAQTEQLDPNCEADVANEKWIPNYLVAPLLATNDLQLSQYVSWEKRIVTPTQKGNLWRVTRRMLVPADDTELAGSMGQVMQKDCATRPKYFEMEHVFWVKLSDFMDLVPHIPHLHGLDIQFLRMHIDKEPSAEEPVPKPQPNGHHVLESPHVNGLSAGTGNLPNGFGHARPSTYV
ncbi:hypothetical protein SI65_01433 [Aspergillus cristatus]|uniref:Uncharacterized protein n=1 Tax=Aspergillus cristatus TaxID=573508 RepID=A0A1E3BS87_ASPCR|nr:hypothetical protein SI65_01433 [Aspergillus cristatus]